MIHKFASEVRINDGTITAVLSSERRDRDGDIIRASGWDLSDFKKAPRLLSCHVYDDLLKHIGKWENVRVREDKLIGEPVYFTDSGNQEAIYGDYLARRGEATYSVGFEPIEHQPLKSVRGTEYLKQSLLETSHVPIPSNADAITLMAKARQSLQKWPIDDDNYGMGNGHCIVPGCDDGSALSVPICEEHLKELVNLPAEPAGGEADEDLMDYIGRALRGYSRRILKAGRTVSGSNMTKVHTALDALHGLHDAGNCTDGDCPYGGDSSGDNDKTLKAASESGDAGLTIADDGTHKPMTGSHSHPPFGQHSHDGDANHSPPAKSAFDTWLEELKAEQSAATQNDLPDSAFAYIEPGGEKDSEGKTVPRSLRHYPHHNASGGIDLPHLRNALARIGDSSNEQGGKAHLESHAKAEGVGEAADSGKGFDLAAAITAAVTGVTANA